MQHRNQLHLYNGVYWTLNNLTCKNKESNNREEKEEEDKTPIATNVGIVIAYLLRDTRFLLLLKDDYFRTTYVGRCFDQD